MIGITGEQMLLKKKNKELIQNYHTRKREVEQYVHKIKPDLIVEIVELKDIFGPAIVR